MREFKTGATRDIDTNKNDYEGFLSPTVLERYGYYMTKHRKQADGQLRDSDNWQKGIPKDVYMKSAWRHFLDVWFIHRGYKRFDKQRNEDITLDEALCALLFNIMGYLHEFLKDAEIKKARPWIENGVCQKYSDEDKGICDLKYACDACPYNRETK
jgi:hypothetical protein